MKAGWDYFKMIKAYYLFLIITNILQSENNLFSYVLRFTEFYYLIIL